VFRKFETPSWQKQKQRGKKIKKTRFVSSFLFYTSENHKHGRGNSIVLPMRTA
jgi:hypothetical protein